MSPQLLVPVALIVLALVVIRALTKGWYRDHVPYPEFSQKFDELPKVEKGNLRRRFQ